MTVRQKLTMFNVANIDFTNAHFTVEKVNMEGPRSMGVIHYVLPYDQLIGLFGFYECLSLKPNLYGSTDYTITIRSN